MKKSKLKIVSVILAGFFVVSMSQGKASAEMKVTQSNFLTKAYGVDQQALNPKDFDLTKPLGYQSSVNNRGIPPYEKEWEQVYGGVGSEVFTAGIATSDGGFLAAGYAKPEGQDNSLGFGFSDGLVVKYNQYGQQVWSKLLGGTLDDFIYSAIETSDKGYVLAGYTESSQTGSFSEKNNGGQDGFLIKLDDKGTVVWSRLFGGKSMDRFYSVIETTSKNLLVVGESGSSKSGKITKTNYGYHDALVAEFSAQGKPLWHQLVGGTGLDYLSSVLEVDDGYVAAGGTYSSASGWLKDKNNGSQDGLLIKLSKSGERIWDQVYGGRAYDCFNGLSQTSDGGFIAAGFSASPISGELTNSGAPSGGALLVKFNGQGKPVWNRIISDQYKMQFTDLIETKTGELLAVGSKAESNSIESDLPKVNFLPSQGFLYKFDTSGKYIWDILTDGDHATGINSVVEANDGSVITAGFLEPNASKVDLGDGLKGLEASFVKYYRPASPTISNEPESVALFEGETVVLNSLASGKPKPAAQWQVQKPGDSTWQNLEAETSNTLSFPAEKELTGNSYRVVYSNQWGSLASQPALVTIKDSEQLTVLAGSSRFGTAVAISQASFQKAKTAILVSSESFPDALAASSLAFELNAPVLLSKKDSLNDLTKSELERLEVNEVIVLGGSAAISDAVLDSLENKLGIKVERLSGKNRYETAVKVAEKLTTLNIDKPSVVLASGKQFADALSSGSYAARLGMPVLLTDGEKLSPALLDYIKLNRIEYLEIIGGEVAVSFEIEQQLERLGLQVSRLAGSSRFNTSAVIASQGFKHSKTALVASGWNFPDALAAAPYAARLDAPVLLVHKDRISPTVENYLSSSNVTKILVIGGEAVIDKEARAKLLKTIKK